MIILKTYLTLQTYIILTKIARSVFINCTFLQGQHTKLTYNV